MTSCGGFAPGLVGTVGFAIYSGGSIFQARGTAGISELPTSSGQYEASVSLIVPAAYVIVWDDGNGHYANENVNIVTYP